MPEATPQIPKPRIQGLSDLIFGLALSIGAVQFIGAPPKDPGMLTQDILSFGFSFLILISVWNRYTTTTSVMPVETPMMIRLNVLLLFLVAIEPFLFGVLFSPGSVSATVVEASVYYALDLGMMNLILAYFTHRLAKEERKLVPKDLIRRFAAIRNGLVVVAVLFFLSALPPFWDLVIGGTPLRLILWFLAIPLLWVHRLLKG